MKTSSLFLIAVVLATTFAAGHLISVENPAPAAPLSPSALEQYRVIDANRIPVASARVAPATLEQVLNELGAEGWRVRTAMGTSIILAR